MKIPRLIIPAFAFLLASAALHAVDTTLLRAQSGSKIRIDGTANMIHTHWAVESPLIAGSLEVSPSFPTEPGQSAAPGKIDAKGECSVPVRSLKSVEDDGKHYSDAMDDVMYGKLKAQDNPKIVYRLTELTLKETPKDKDSPYVFDSKGEITVAGVTNAVAFPVSVLPIPGNKIKVSGNTTFKMTDFKIQPPAPTMALGAIKTGDEVKISFQWLLAPKTADAAK
jgi:polyisoprenoid-binding protein YceI